MSFHDFTQEIDRLKATYGDNYFAKERISLIWNQTKDLEARSFAKICTWFIANNKTAPLPADFNEQAVIERKRTHHFQINGPQRFYHFPDSVLSHEERAEIFKIMILAAQRKITRLDAMKFAEALADALVSKDVKPDPWREQNKYGDWIA